MVGKPALNNFQNFLEGGGPGQLPMSIWQAPDGEVGQQVRQVLTLSECRDCGRMGTLA